MMGHKTRKTLLLTLFLALSSGSLFAQEHPRVLFVGNSYTQVNDLPQMIADIAQSMGEDMEYRSYGLATYQSGSTIRWHCRGKQLVGNFNQSQSSRG